MNRKLFAAAAFMAAMAIKLPYEAGQSFVVVQGYNSPPTHIKKDLYAIDFSQDGCDAYGKLAVAAGGGTVMLAQESGYNGGYGTQVLVKNDSNIVARYAHMIPGTIPVAEGAAVVQGEPLGEIGNTGLVAGAACPTHPGTHIHFAMYGENADGSFSPFLPEPISNYVGITEGKWYLSDNAIAITSVSGATAIIERAMQEVFGTGTGEGSGGGDANSGATNNTAGDLVAISSSVLQTNSIITTRTVSTSPIYGGGGISSIVQANGVSASLVTSSLSLPVPPENVSTNQSSTPIVSPPPPPAPPMISIANDSFDSSTLAIDLSWQVSGTQALASGTPVYQIFSTGATSTPIATTTGTTFSYPLSEADFATSTPLQFEIAATFGDSAAGDNSASDTAPTISTVETVPVALPNWETAIQLVDGTNSNGSWYSDNWYDLGAGFYGTIKSLTFEGFIDGSYYSGSHLHLQEYADPNYSQLIQDYPISEGAPFTNSLKKITISGLDIPLQPNKYYRLTTLQDFQNRSVILEGTSATGTAMWDGYVYGVGIVRYQYAFYPYISAIMIPDYPPLQPPGAPPSLSINFDSLNSVINLGWPAATDPDTTSSLLTYQINIASSTPTTSSTLDSSAWQSVGKNLATSTPVVFDNSYTIGVRAVDDLGNIGLPLVQAWNFPDGYAPVPQQLDHSIVVGGDGGAQEIAFLATTTVRGIGFWTNGVFGAWCCSDSAISIHQNIGGSMGPAIATSETVRTGPYAGDGERVYTFDSPPTLSPGLYWFLVENPSGWNDTQIFGSPGDSYPDGFWSPAASRDAYFRIQE